MREFKQEYKTRDVIAGGCLFAVMLFGLFVILGICGVWDAEEPSPATAPAPIATRMPEPTPTPTPMQTATPMPTAASTSDLPWWDMDAQEYREINARTEQWSMEALGFPPGFDAQPELRANACRIWDQLGYDFNRLDEYGRANIAQGLITVAEFEVVDTILGMMHGVLVNQYMDNYMDARRAGHTSVTPAETIVPAYCALRPVFDAK